MDDLVKRLRGWPPSVAHNVMQDAADRIEELEAKLAKAEAEKFTVGALTMKHVFRPSGLTNVFDMQAVFDATERGFEELEARLEKAVEALEWVKFGGGPNGESYHLNAIDTLAELTGGNDE